MKDKKPIIIDGLSGEAVKLQRYGNKTMIGIPTKVGMIELLLTDDELGVVHELLRDAYTPVLIERNGGVDPRYANTA